MPRRTLLVASFLALAATAPGLAASHASATIPVSCVMDEVVLTLDDTDYELVGACGTVVVDADRSTVSMSTSTHLYVTGDATQVTGTPQGTVEVSGAGSSVSAPSATTLSLTGAGASASVRGLVERVRVEADGASLRAARTHVLVVRGTANVVDVSRGFRTRLVGDANVVTHRRLDRLRVRGSSNTVTVAAGRTASKVVGTDNDVSLRRPRR